MVEGEIRHEAKCQRRLERARKKRELVNKARIEMKQKIREETKQRTEEREDSSSNSLRDALKEMSLTWCDVWPMALMHKREAFDVTFDESFLKAQTPSVWCDVWRIALMH